MKIAVEIRQGLIKLLIAAVIGAAGLEVSWRVWVSRTLAHHSEDIAVIRCILEKQNSLSVENCFGSSDRYATH